MHEDMHPTCIYMYIHLCLCIYTRTCIFIYTDTERQRERERETERHCVRVQIHSVGSDLLALGRVQPAARAGECGDGGVQPRRQPSFVEVRTRIPHTCFFCGWLVFKVALGMVLGELRVGVKGPGFWIVI